MENFIHHFLVAACFHTAKKRSSAGDSKRKLGFYIPSWSAEQKLAVSRFLNQNCHDQTKTQESN
jgi:hypothetical protein